MSDEVVGKVEGKDVSLLMEYKLKFGISKKFSKKFDVTVEFDREIKEDIMRWLGSFSSEIERYKQLEKVHRYAATVIIYLITIGPGMPTKPAISNRNMRNLYNVLKMSKSQLKKFDERQLPSFKKVLSGRGLSVEYTDVLCDSFSMLIRDTRLDTTKSLDKHFQDLAGVVYTQLVRGLRHELGVDKDVFVESSFKIFEKGKEGNFDKLVERSSELYEDVESFMKTFMPYMLKAEGYKIKYEIDKDGKVTSKAIR